MLSRGATVADKAPKADGQGRSWHLEEDYKTWQGTSSLAQNNLPPSSLVHPPLVVQFLDRSPRKSQWVTHHNQSLEKSSDNSYDRLHVHIYVVVFSPAAHLSSDQYESKCIFYKRVKAKCLLIKPVEAVLTASAPWPATWHCCFGLYGVF